MLPEYLCKPSQSRSHTHGQASCAPALTLPLPQQSLPSFSSVLSSLGIKSNKLLQSPSENAARQGCATFNGTKGDFVALPDGAGQPSPSEYSGIVAGTSESTKPNGPSLISTETSATPVDSRSLSLTQGGFSETGTQICPIGNEVLKIVWGLSSRSRLRSYPQCAVQLQDHSGNPRGKASLLQIYTTESTVPRLHVRVYHDPDNPERFSTSSPTWELWLDCKLHCSKRILKPGYSLTLAKSLQLSTTHYEAKLDEWGFSQRDKEVLDIALNKVGEGGPNGPLENQPWKHFLECCIEWEKSKGWRDHKAVEAKRKKSTYRRG